MANGLGPAQLWIFAFHTVFHAGIKQSKIVVIS